MSIAKRLKEQVAAGRIVRARADALLRRIHKRYGLEARRRPASGDGLPRNGSAAKPQQGS